MSLSRSSQATTYGQWTHEKTTATGIPAKSSSECVDPSTPAARRPARSLRASGAPRRECYPAPPCRRSPSSRSTTPSRWVCGRIRALRSVSRRSAAFAPRAGLMLVCAHRAETDVPLICPSLYCRAGYFRDRAAERIHFAARDDMFDRGFFAGFPGGLPPRARRFLYPLERGCSCRGYGFTRFPTRGSRCSASAARSNGSDRRRRSRRCSPNGLLSCFGRVRGPTAVASPAAAGEVLERSVRGPAVEILLPRGAGRAPAGVGLAAACGRGRRRAPPPRRARARRTGAADLPGGEALPRRLAVGPSRRALRRSCGSADRRPSSRSAIAYDRLTRGRARAVVSFGPPVEPPARATSSERCRRALAARCRSRAAQVVAAELAAARRRGSDAAIRIADLEAALAGCCAGRRPADRGARHEPPVGARASPSASSDARDARPRCPGADATSSSSTASVIRANRRVMLRGTRARGACSPPARRSALRPSGRPRTSAPARSSAAWASSPAVAVRAQQPVEDAREGREDEASPRIVTGMTTIACTVRT